MVPAAVLFAIVTQHPVVRAEQLVARLGSPSFAVREQAGKELVAAGRAGLLAVHRGLSHRDAEVAERSRRLLPLVEAEVARQRTAHMRALLLTDPPARIPADEPLVQRFLAVTGDTPAARELYFRMYTDHAKLLDAVELSDPGAAGRAFWDYVDRTLMYPDGRTLADLNSQTYNRPDLALFWFLSADKRVAPGECRGFGRPDFPYYFPKHAEGHLSGPSAIPEMRRLFAAWLAGPRNVADPVADQRMLMTGFHLAAEAGVKEVRPLVLRAVRDRTISRSARVAALLALLRLGEPEDPDGLADLIADDSVVFQAQPIREPGRTVVAGDVALAMCVRLTGRRLAEFGFPDARKAEADPSGLAHYGFPNKKARAAARQKWAVWNAARVLLPGGKP
jgi:hypothetical protein